MPWTSAAQIRQALGSSTPIVAADTDWLDVCADAANAASFRKRREAGYIDDADVAPDAAVTMGATLWGVALWRQRASTDGFPSFEELSAFQPTGGAWGEIRRQLGIGRAAVDAPPAPDAVAPIMRRRRRRRFW